MRPKIAVSTMTNCQSFFDDGAYEAIRKLKMRGIDCIEISQHIQFNQDTIPEILQAVEDFDMEICAMSGRYDGIFPHKGLPPHQGIKLKSYSLEADYKELVEYMKKFKCRYLRFAGFPCEHLVDEQVMRQYMQGLAEIVKRYRQAGIVVCAHNHTGEFMRLGGRTLYDWSLELVPDLMYEVDVLNAQKSGVNPAELIRKVGKRAVLTHLQDIRVKPAVVGETGGGRELQPVGVGDGNLDYAAICAAAVEAGTQYLILEQGAFYGEDPYGCIERSARKLNSFL